MKKENNDILSTYIVATMVYSEACNKAERGARDKFEFSVSYAAADSLSAANAKLGALADKFPGCIQNAREKMGSMAGDPAGVRSVITADLKRKNQELTERLEALRDKSGTAGLQATKRLDRANAKIKSLQKELEASRAGVEAACREVLEEAGVDRSVETVKHLPKPSPVARVADVAQAAGEDMPDAEELARLFPGIPESSYEWAWNKLQQDKGWNSLEID